MDTTTRELISNIAEKEEKSGNKFLDNLRTGAWNPTTDDQRAQRTVDLLAFLGPTSQVQSFSGMVASANDRGFSLRIVSSFVHHSGTVEPFT